MYEDLGIKFLGFLAKAKLFYRNFKKSKKTFKIKCTAKNIITPSSIVNGDVNISSKLYVPTIIIL